MISTGRSWSLALPSIRGMAKTSSLSVIVELVEKYGGKKKKGKENAASKAGTVNVAAENQ